MTLLPTNTVARLADVTVLTCNALVSFVYWSVERIYANCRIKSLVMDLNCPLPDIRPVPQLKTDAIASEGGLAYPMPLGPDSPRLWCMYHWSYNFSNTCVSVYRKFFFGMDDQRLQDRAICKICVHVMMWVGFSVEHDLFRSV